jgi:uncharacterized SAM-binding protein YcdF (DUF218 family)
MLLFKKIVAHFFFPMPLMFLFSFAGLFLLWFTARQKTGKIFITAGLTILVLSGYSQTSDILIKSLESRYPPLSNDIFMSSPDQRPKLVVVLGGGSTSNPDFPITSQAGSASLTRLIEGIRIYRQIPGCKLVLSGGSMYDPVPEAVTMARVAESIGVDEQDIIIESGSMHTNDQARILGSMLGDKDFILVTSASHMPRAMVLFKKLNMNPVPAPAHHQVIEKDYLTADLLLPSSGNTGKTKTAIYEYMGIIFSKLNGQI